MNRFKVYILDNKEVKDIIECNKDELLYKLIDILLELNIHDTEYQNFIEIISESSKHLKVSDISDMYKEDIRKYSDLCILYEFLC